jgi:transcriptional regulator with XRE-family HTH domain
MTQAGVATETGIAESTISEILKGKRGLNRKHIEVLAKHFKVSPAVFLVNDPIRLRDPRGEAVAPDSSRYLTRSPLIPALSRRERAGMRGAFRPSRDPSRVTAGLLSPFLMLSTLVNVSSGTWHGGDRRCRSW